MNYLIKKLPIGIEFFEDIRTQDFYYVDKTNFIKELINMRAGVNLFTRPRRFGKSLNMDMLKSFFEIGNDKELFEGLYISEETALCEQYQGKFPVISISLKDVDGRSYERSLKKMETTLKKEIRRHQYLLKGDKLSEVDKDSIRHLFTDPINEIEQEESLYLLTEMLYKYHEKKVIVLIDEYDVPLDKAYSNGYYEEMVEHLRGLFGEVLKTNPNLYFAVLTGCLRISKESIFTGINNFKVHTIMDASYDEYFGFTDQEVKQMLSDYHIETQYHVIKEWYDGYKFGKENIYCPWDVINYIADYLSDSEITLKLYWLNTSGNYIIRQLIKRSDANMREEIERLIAGKSIQKEIKTELTYKDLDIPEYGDTDTSRNNLWSILYTTGYLTTKSCDGKIYELIIPNREIHDIFVTQIKEWMQDTIIQGNLQKLKEFWQAIVEGNTSGFEQMFRNYLLKTISIRDTNAANNMKENFYHGLLLGILRGNDAWLIKSNKESGIGYADIILEIPDKKIGCVFEMKYAQDGNLEKSCDIALKQIENKNYTEILKENGMNQIYQYGVACYKKDCKIKKA